MNVLFLTLLSFSSLSVRNIYTDLLREFYKNGHRVYVISPTEKREGETTHLVLEEDATILRLQIGDTQKTNIIKKGINTVLIEPAFKNAINRYFADVKFDLVLFSTPPITLASAIEHIKKRDGAKSYLMLKDIFPQNAVDLGMMSKTGINSWAYKYFRRKEKKLYQISDYIGCMSQANVDYLLHNNKEIDPSIVEICPNSIEVLHESADENLRTELRNKYAIPQNKTVFVYGGNLGRPQDIPFIIECLKKCQEIENAFFLIVGSGTEYRLLENYVSRAGQRNVMLIRFLPKEDYDKMLYACDVGLIFLDHRFTIPNFPSRLLSYMQAKLPVLACTDPNTDVGKVITEGGFGWWCESNSSEAFKAEIKKVICADLKESGNKGFQWLEKYWNVKRQYQSIAKTLGWSD